MRRILSAVTACVLVCAAPAALAATLFHDDFSGELAKTGGSSLNYGGFDNFTVSDGTVDLIAHGAFSIECGTGQAACVDLDGSTGNSGVLQTVGIDLLAGVDYALALLIGGNSRGGSDEVAVRLWDGLTTPSTLLSLSFVWSDPVAAVATTITPLVAGTYFIQIEDLGNDNTGAILSAVTLSSPDAAIPLPAAAPLLVGALAGLGAIRRRG